ncbi:MAG TPA: twin-arginine translocase subunit TatC [Longilinea sp.]|nr:twin-arginine translocase subunit TatC [Longilinea sp.]
MSFWDHVEELRRRLIVAMIALAVTTMISFAFADKIIALLTIPIGGPDKLQAIEVTENVTVFMKVSLLSGFLLALPVILYELMAFIIPGLKPSERRWLILGIFFATLMFALGVAFAYLVMLPNALPFLLNFLNIPTSPRPSSYFDFVTGLLFWIGASFQTPLIIFILARFGVVKGSDLLKYWRVAIVVIAIVAAVVTPTPDPVNMSILMAPLIVLYFLSVLLAFLAQRRNKPDEQPPE